MANLMSQICFSWKLFAVGTCCFHQKHSLLIQFHIKFISLHVANALIVKSLLYNNRITGPNNKTTQSDLQNVKLTLTAI